MTRVLEAQKTSWGRANPFLMRIESVFSEKAGYPGRLDYMTDQHQRLDSLENVRAILAMISSRNQEELALGKDLINYIFITSGVHRANSYIQYIHPAYYSILPIAETLRSIQNSNFDSAYLDISKFTKMYIQHTPKDAYRIDTSLVIHMFLNLHYLILKIKKLDHLHYPILLDMIQ